MNRTLPLLAALALLPAACTSSTPPPAPTPTVDAMSTVEATASVEARPAVTATATAEATPAPAPRLTPEAAAVVEASRHALAVWLGVDPSLLTLDVLVRTNWRDSCLEFGRPNQDCDDRDVPGYFLRILISGEAAYEVRTNLDGTLLVWSTQYVVEGTFAALDRELLTIDGEFPGALDERRLQFVVVPGSDISIVDSLRYGDPVLVAGDGRPSSDVPLLIWIERDPERERPPADDPERVAGAAHLALSAMLESGGLEVSSIEAVEWLDTCLEVPRPGVHCTAVPFPGYRVRLEHESGAAYEIRTNAEGSQFVWSGDRVVEGVVREVTVATSVRIETDDGEPIRARVLAGSTLGTPIASSLLNDRLRLTLAPDPQGNGWVVVILERLAEG